MNKYALSMKKKFSARHRLVGGDWGRENKLHAHRYTLTATIFSSKLDKHGYLIDIVKFDKIFNLVMADFKDKILNNLPVFNRRNPSIERFAQIICNTFCKHDIFKNISTIKIDLAEDEIAVASFKKTVK
jgi:6-pyruvoyltetrahydropterin/6-carboxytetrahydropterin synthase